MLWTTTTSKKNRGLKVSVVVIAVVTNHNKSCATVLDASADSIFDGSINRNFKIRYKSVILNTKVDIGL